MSIIAILATIAVPVFLGQRTRAMQKEALTNLEAMRLLQEQYFAEKGEYAPPDPAIAGTELGACDPDRPGNIIIIQGVLPAFKPGRGDDLYFSYCYVKDMEINTDFPLEALVGSDPCFTARAFGNSGTQVEGQEFRVDCNNVKTY
jgi:type II secretory pathway pseudopilin PulG